MGYPIVRSTRHSSPDTEREAWRSHPELSRGSDAAIGRSEVPFRSGADLAPSALICVVEKDQVVSVQARSSDASRTNRVQPRPSA